MARRRFRWKGYELSVEVPETVAERLRALRKKPAEPQPSQDLEFMKPLPALHTQPRDPVKALDMIRLPEGVTEVPWAPKIGDVPAGSEELAKEVATLAWYHTIELPGGVVTPGEWDHRSLVPHYGLPDDMTGMRALDVATFDGFWAFEMERRGADVTAVDLARASLGDFPPQAKEQMKREGVDVEFGRGFELAKRARGSKVERVPMSVYDLNPDSMGTFDYVHMGDLLVHLERPISALRAVRSVTKNRAHFVEVYVEELADPDRLLIQYYGAWDKAIWTRPSLDTFAQLVIDAGFNTVKLHNVYRLRRSFEGTMGEWRAILIAEV